MRATSPGGGSETVLSISIDPGNAGRRVSPTLFGLFLEDLNYALDGGLNANLVNNYSFDAVYLDRRRNNFPLQIALKRAGKPLPDRVRHWSVSGGTVHALPREGEPGAHFGRVRPAETRVPVRVSNNGYPGATPGMGAREAVAWGFSAEVRAPGGETTVRVRLVDADGQVVAEASPVRVGGAEWTVMTARLVPQRTALVRLEIEVDGEIDLDEVRLIPSDHWGAGDPRWSQGVLRRDLVEAIRDAGPTFLRFPGGCVVEGLDLDNAYDWRRTIGPLRDRRGDYNLWALSTPGGDYSQSQQIGFYEFFLLCEDLGITPLPVVNAGLACQMRSRESVDLHAAGFDAVVQQVLDLIDWATGDPATNTWAALRAEAGHPEPFALEMIAIGNENHGPEYTERFTRIKDALEARHAGLTYVLSSGAMPAGKGFDHSWGFAATDPERVVVDEHFYKKPEWFVKAADRYDDYRRGGAKVFAGEYAAFAPTIVTPRRMRNTPTNTLRSAVAECAFYTGLVRNSDVVAMSSYAPLLNRVGAGQWEHNFIDFNPFTVQPTLNYWAQSLFSLELGTAVADIRGALPAGLYAVATTDPHRTIVRWVNTTDESLTVRIDSGRPEARFAAASTLTGAPDDALRLDHAATTPHRRPIRDETLPVADGTVLIALPGNSVVRVVV